MTPSSNTFQTLLQQTADLTPEEKLRLIAHLADSLRYSQPAPAAPRRKWSEIQGSAPYPLMGEDAQTWISRSRREADDRREQRLRGEP